MRFEAQRPLRVACFIWGLAALFYLIGFFQRVAPAVLADLLMRDLNLHATGLGNLSAFYFYSYVAMQIPTGLAADVWGPRRLLTAGAFIASTGTAIFALSPGILWACLGRLLVGGAVAVAFVALLKITTAWFPPRYYGFLTGMALFFGIVGAVFAGPPLKLLADLFHWRIVIFSTAVMTFILGIGIWVHVRDHPHEKGYTESTEYSPSAGRMGRSEMFSGIGDVFRYPNTALLAGIPGGIVGCVLTFSGLWGVPFLTTHYGLSITQASTMTTALLISWALGGPFFGWLSDRTGRRKLTYIFGCGIALISWSLIFFAVGLSLPHLALVMLLGGFSSGCIIISFSFAKESIPFHLTGTLSGVINMGIMMGPMILQPAVGWILDYYWTGQTSQGIRVYSLSAYHAGFTLMIAWIAVSFLLLFFTRETRYPQIKMSNP